jgi:hypothetical protein
MYPSCDVQRKPRDWVRLEATPGPAVSGLLRKKGAPALRADFPLDQFAGVRRLKIVTPVAALCIFRLILVRGRFLSHLGLRGRRIQPEAVDDAAPTPEVATRWNKTRRERSFRLLGTGVLHAIRSVEHSHVHV